MRHFAYADGVLHAEGVDLRALAEAVGTPAFIYSQATLERHHNVLKAAFAPLDVHVCYAVKANANQAVIATLARQGAGADTVSEGEIRRAMAAGIDAAHIVFAGVGKTDAELAFAIGAGVRQINVESAAELERVSALAGAMGRVQDIALRVNPDVGAGGHAKITTGKAQNKFGIEMDAAEALYAQAAGMAGVRPVGLSVHIGSQIVDLSPLEAAYTRMAGSVARLRARGLSVSRLDLGGGLAAIYEEGAGGPDLSAYGAMVRRVVGPLDVGVDVEPGRMIAANAGILLSRVVLTKRNGGRDFVVLDAAMNDLIRPALYDAYHEILPVAEPEPAAGLAPKDVVGPVCETGDTFALARPLPPLQTGDLVALMGAGAYGFAMASTYNSRRLPPEVLVSGERWAVTRPRQTWEEMFGMESCPPWLGAPQ